MEETPASSAPVKEGGGVNMVFTRQVMVGAVVGVVVGVVVGLFFGMQFGNKSVGAPTQSVGTSSNGGPAQNPIFSEQSATGVGKITAMNGSIITFAASDGTVSQFKLGSNLTVYKYKSPGVPASSYNDASAIELNKDAVVNFSAEGNQYVASAVTILVPENTSAPVGSGR